MAFDFPSPATTGQVFNPITGVIYIYNGYAWDLMGSSIGVFSVGDMKPTHRTSADPGWIMWVDGTFGDASSSGSVRANADTVNLFGVYYNGYTDAQLPLLTSTGAATTRAAQGTNTAAFNAHCRMTLPKGSGRAIGNAGAGTGLTSRASSDALGGETSTQTNATLFGHQHTGIQIQNVDTADSWNAWTNSGITLTTNGATGVQGGSAPFSIMPPIAFANWMIKL